MTTDGDSGAGVSAAWDAYWHGARDGGAFSRHGAAHPAVLGFWRDYFTGLRDADGGALRCIDIASGNGAVIDCASDVLRSPPPSFTCVDISPSAVAMLQQRFADVHALVADAREIPLESGTFDVVTSQFGLEYAGPGALEEAARLVAPGGELALLMHHAGGHIYRRCAASLAAIREMQAARFVPLCHAMFQAAFAVRDGDDPAAYRQAGAAFAPALRAMENIMHTHGRDVADGTVVRLYRDVRTIHQRLRQYAAEDVLGWLSSMEGEIESYAGRMASMCESATDAPGFDALCARLRESGFTLERADALAAADLNGVLAWALIARRDADAGA